MNKTLILVESPTKARTLYRFLGSKYQIEASMGHIRDLPKGDIGIDIEKNFEPRYVIPKDKRKTVEHLKSMAKQYDSVFLATDPDREGEAIAYHLKYILNNEKKNKLDFKRIVFHEITENAIKEALGHPREIDQSLVNAQTARRVLDRIVGYKLSPLLWRKIKRNLSAGRVQSIALRLIVEREREIEKFKTEPYFKISVILNKEKEPLEFILIEINGDKVEQTVKLDLYDGEYKYTKTNIDKKSAEEIENELKIKTYQVIDVIQKETKRSPHPPYITSSLQQDAARRLSFASKRTMSVAQKLYEEGFITYHRTDSFNISKQFMFPARSFIEKEYGKKYLSESPHFYKTKSKVAQEAHEAIRPTKVGPISDIKDQVSGLGRDHLKLYELIYKRAIATQMADAIFESTKILVQTDKQNEKDNTYLFEKNGSILKFDGFLKVTGANEEDNLLPVIEIGEKLNFQDAKITESKTNPPPRYSEASVIASLEKNGIGRPSTYAAIISTVQERNYLEKEEGRFTPTAIGIIVNDFLVKNFPNIDDIPFTSQMENKLDEIANGEQNWTPMIKEFYIPFEEMLKKAESEEKIMVPEEKTGEKCPQCGNDIIIRTGRFGKFLACSNFPECKHTAPFIQETSFSCPKDNGKVIMRKTKKGRTFYGCSNYPTCDFAAWNLNALKKLQKTDIKAQTT